ncbi:hypothetical protein Q5P01_003994 [Channa striata]|uniref:Uncharacterized protein n=1 Tax=Channa striata TaxID=64152 RepID=A0AA88NHZ5_CHASR|nr:hypothetical protein Q5P01_003994 [Channa striata]
MRCPCPLLAVPGQTHAAVCRKTGAGLFTQVSECFSSLQQGQAANPCSKKFHDFAYEAVGEDKNTAQSGGLKVNIGSEYRMPLLMPWWVKIPQRMIWELLFWT